MLRIYQAATALVIAASFALPACAKASIMQFGFDATLQTGALAGTEFFGTASYNNQGSTGVGQEFLSLTSINFSLDGFAYTLANIGQGGQAILQNGALSYFTAAFFPGPPNPVDDIALGFGGPGIIGYSTAPGFNSGQGAYTLLAPVPEPPALVLGSIALLVSSFVLSQRRHLRYA